MTLCSNISFSQRPLTDSELRIVYEKVIRGEWCAEDLAASQEVIKSLSVIIDSLNTRIQQNTLFVDGLIAENDRLAKENYGLVAGIEQKKAEVKYNKPFGLSAVGGYGLTGSGQSGFVGVGLTWTPKFLRF